MGIYSYLFAIGCPLWFFAVCVFFSLLRPLFPGATTLTEKNILLLLEIKVLVHLFIPMFYNA